jgi:hypothetical protein
MPPARPTASQVDVIELDSDGCVERVERRPVGRSGRVIVVDDDNDLRKSPVPRKRMRFEGVACSRSCRDPVLFVAELEVVKDPQAQRRAREVQDAAEVVLTDSASNEAEFSGSRNVQRDSVSAPSRGIDPRGCQRATAVCDLEAPFLHGGSHDNDDDDDDDGTFLLRRAFTSLYLF